MSEQRLIDANKFLKWLDVGHLRNPDEICLSEINVKNMIDLQPTIDPETLPIVRQLREENEKLKQSFGDTFACDLMDKLDKAEKELDMVTAERDSAVSDLENIMAYNSDTCQLCKNKQCYVRGGTKPCLPKWRGPQKEE